MYYHFAVTVPAGTTEVSPVTEILKLTAGVIHDVSIRFAAGCRHYVYLKLLHQEHQVWPTNPEQAFRGENILIPIKEYYPLTTEPFSLKAVAYAPNTIYDHTLRINVGLLTEEELEPLKELPQKFTDFFKLLGVKV